MSKKCWSNLRYIFVLLIFFFVLRLLLPASLFFFSKTQVYYDCTMFLEKNRDTLSKNVASLLSSAGNKLVALLFTPQTTEATDEDPLRLRSRTMKTSESLKQSVSSTFKQSLNDLMAKMLAARPHFIRWVFLDILYLSDQSKVRLYFFSLFFFFCFFVSLVSLIDIHSF